MSQPVSSAPQHWHPGQKVVALFNFDGSSDDDLPFRKHDRLTILRNTSDPNWYHAQSESGKEGMIPSNYVKPASQSPRDGRPPGPPTDKKEVRLNAMPWFHGNITREKTEDILNPRQDGLFLIRDSQNFKGNYTLSVAFEQKVEHYKILFQNNKLTIDEEEYFDNLTDLVDHYKKDADGLCVNLKQGLEKKGPLNFSVNQDDFVAGGWVIDKSQLELGDTIGKGEFGAVLKGVFKGQKIAVKTLKDDTRAAQGFLAEASLMTSLRHPNLVELMGVVLGETIYIVTEFMGKGNLADFLRSRGRSIIVKKDQLNFARDVCAGMAYLESADLVHRDLAARNILLSDECIAKVSDFGLARHTESNQEGGKFPIKWTAPEALRDNLFSNKSDVWSFGILLWEIYAFGRMPYPRIPLADVVHHVSQGYRMEKPEGCPQNVYLIMGKCWDESPNKRPAFSEMLQKLELFQTQST
ncbi:tyrosine-protein kinase CSK-like [Lineus longissimus]|uniref:tyrosine-protein kinase CSK-like n=1 Tax=Lineus longissimus TaxID=88925 RepID=UPI002B4DB0A3